MAQTLEAGTIPGMALTVVTPWGKETYQILLRQITQGWTARIVTLPNRIWVHTNGREAVKFFGSTQQEAEAAAAAHIEQTRVASGRRLWAPRAGTPDAGRPEPGTAHPVVSPAQTKAAARIAQRILLRFGVGRPEWPGVTANLSETGLFIITARPEEIGSHVEMDVRFPEAPIGLSGEVVWIRGEKAEGLSVGCGVRLVRRSSDYIARLRSLLRPQ